MGALNVIAQELALDFGDAIYPPRTLVHMPWISNDLADVVSLAYEPCKGCDVLDHLRGVVRTQAPARAPG